MSILSAISAAMSLLDHLWQAYNNSGMVQAKVAQMSQNDKDKHAELINKAMHGTVEERKAALAEIQKLVSE